MTVAYGIGLCLGALFSAFVVSRALLWLARNWNAGAARLMVTNGLSFIIIVGVSIVVRGEYEWAAAIMHLIAQAIWLCLDLWRANGAPRE